MSRLDEIAPRLAAAHAEAARLLEQADRDVRRAQARVDHVRAVVDHRELMVLRAAVKPGATRRQRARYTNWRADKLARIREELADAERRLERAVEARRAIVRPARAARSTRR